jgi:hypothetical protein
MKIVLTYPSGEDEKKIWTQECNKTTEKKKTNTEKRNPEDLIEMIDYIASNVRVDDQIYEYVGSII